MISLRLVIFLNWCLFSLSFSFAIAKDSLHYAKQNKSFYFPKYRPEIFYDNKVLPEDIEVDVFVFKDQLQRLFYVLEGGYRPLSITVTPCSSPLEWRLSHQAFPSTATGASASYHADPWYNQVVRPQAVASLSPAASYSGPERRAYTNPRAPPGLYTLELNSATTTKTRIVVTTRSCTENSYHPPLPPEPDVQVIKVKRNRVLISWKASTSRPVEYCVTSNTASNYNSLCAANADLNGDNPSMPPAGSGFGFHWEKSSKKSILSNFVTHVPKHNVSLTCVGRKTWHMFKGLDRGKTYFFDVFVVDTETNSSTAYVGVKASVKSVVKPSWIRDDSLVTLTLDNTNGFAVTAKYQILKNPGAVLLFIQSCTGPGPIILSITKTGLGGRTQEILSDSIMDVKTLEIPHQMASLERGNGSSYFTLTVRSSIKNGRKVRIWISGKKHAFPFPVLPSDKNVKVFDTLINCDSITIGWKASPDERVKYCIYRRAARDDLMRRTLAAPQNFCELPIDGSSDRTTVLCRRYHRFSKRRFNNVIMQRVRGLEPSTTYLFEVQVTKVKGKMLPYEQVWATTTKTCTNSRNKR